MSGMLQALRQQQGGCYPPQCASELEQMETMLLHYPAFGQKEALELGCRIVEASAEHGDMLIRIQRQSDGAVLFQTMGDSCSPRNLEFAMMKQKTALKTGHCSLWGMVQAQITGGLDELFDEQNGCLPVGGAFPIYVNGELTAVISSSGLHNGLDHQVIVEALASLRGVEPPVFHGKLI